MWEQLNGLYLRLQQVQATSRRSSRPHSLAQLVIEGVQLFQGITDATMGHGEGWHYLQVGRFLERAECDRGTARPALPRTPGLAARHRDGAIAEQVGLLRSCCSDRGVLPTLHRRCAARSGSWSSCCSTRSFRGRCGSPRAARDIAAGDRTVHVRRAGGKAERVAGRLHAQLDYGQVDEILRRRSAHLPGGNRAHCAQIHAAINQSYIAYPSSRRCRRSRMPMTPCSTPSATSRVHLRYAGRRERHGSAHAAAKRRPPALHPFRPQHHARVPRVDLPGSRRQHRPSLQHPRQAWAADAEGRSARGLLASAGGARSPRR